jgi:hypothetical protein
MTVPFAIRASYQTKHYNAGTPQQPDNSVFDALAFPPESGLEAAAASLAAAQELGIVQPDSEALLRQTSHRDGIREFYDSSSIQRDE